jgi:protein-S-isoprenylcysteine O-methyltransferase Ste14
MKHWKLYILSCIWGPVLAAQIVLVLVFGFVNSTRISILVYISYITWVISMIFGWLPIFTLKKKGGVEKGQSYVHTTVLVTTGIYSIVRHPQYTAGILFSLALMLFSQQWLIIAMGCIVIPLLYIDILMTDKHETEKFGEVYKKYMKEVPGTNFLLGLFRRMKRR